MLWKGIFVQEGISDFPWQQVAPWFKSGHVCAALLWRSHDVSYRWRWRHLRVSFTRSDWKTLSANFMRHWSLVLAHACSDDVSKSEYFMRRHRAVTSFVGRHLLLHALPKHFFDASVAWRGVTFLCDDFVLSARDLAVLLRSWSVCLSRICSIELDLFVTASAIASLLNDVAEDV